LDEKLMQIVTVACFALRNCCWQLFVVKKTYWITGKIWFDV